MQVTPDVIRDLFPLYVSGEASIATRSLVEDYLRHNPDLGTELQTAWSDTTPAEPLPPSLEVRTLRRARQLITLRTWLLGVAIFLTLLPGTTAHINGTTYGFAHYYPVPALVAFLCATGCWIAWFMVGRRVRTI